MANKTSRTTKKDELFITALKGGASVSRACVVSTYTRSRVYEWREDDADFAAQWDSAVEEGTDKLEDEAYRRAVEGWREPVFGPRGFQIGEIQKYSDTLTIFLLKGRRPKKFKERRELTGANDGPIQIDDTGLTDDERLTRLTTLLDLARARRDRQTATDGSGVDPAAGTPDGSVP